MTPMRIGSTTRVTYILALLSYIAAAQNAGSQPAQKGIAPKRTTQSRRALEQGGKAYVRIKEFQSEPRKTAQPIGETQTVHYGDAVQLVTKQDVGPTYWLISDGKGGPQFWIPGYLLTTSVAEINMLRTRARIPETMTYIYEQPGVDGKLDAKQHGRVHLPGFGMIVTINGDEGVDITDEGSSQLAIAGDAVIFDEAVFKQPAWAVPMTFSDGQHTFRMAPGKMFYCTSAAGHGKFDVFDLP